MHGTLGGPYYKGPGGDPADTDSADDANTVNNSGGSGQASRPQRAIPGPETTGGPVSMKKALAKKPLNSGTGVGGPNKGTSAPGSV